MLQREQLLRLLPPAAQSLFLEIDDGIVLGASRHIDMIGEIFCLICEEACVQDLPLQELQGRLLTVAEYMDKSRGSASQAVANAIRRMTAGVAQFRGSSPQLVQMVRHLVEDYRKHAAHCLDAIIQYALNEFSHIDRMLLFDYSSTVANILKALPSNTSRHIYVPESRSIDGGIEYAEIAAKRGFQVHFFPDAAMLYYLQSCQAALVGAETFYPDGTAFNTTGSDILGLLCANTQVPLYVVTPLIKVDFRSLKGNHKEPVIRDLSHLYAQRFQSGLQERLDFLCPEQLAIPPQWIHAYITEEGILAPNALYQVSKEAVAV